MMPDVIESTESTTRISGTSVQDGSDTSPVHTTVCMVSPFDMDSEQMSRTEENAEVVINKLSRHNLSLN